MDLRVCTVCEFVYDPAAGMPDHGIAPGTPFESLPQDWICPDCGARQHAFSTPGEERQDDGDVSDLVDFISSQPNHPGQ